MDSETETKIVQATCTQCKAPFEAKMFSLGGREFGARICPKCRDEYALEAEREQERMRERERMAKWEKCCPTIYRDTDPDDHRLNQDARRIALDWNVKSPRGLGFIGTTGLGKTRCLFLALRRAHDAGLRVASISHTKFSRRAMDAYSGNAEEKAEAREVLAKLHSAAVLLIDDLGKPPSTERADSELEELVEDRTSEAKPILWSANGSGEWLIKRFGVDRGEPTVRRLAEFSEVLTLQ